MNRAGSAFFLGSSLLAILVAAGTGCGDSINNGGATPTPTASGTATATPTATASPSSNATPQSGEWEYGEYTPSTNDCHDPDLVSNGSGNFGLLDHGNGTVTIDPQDDSAPFDCSVSGGSISCPDRAAGSYPITGLDATLDAHVRADGVVSDPAHFAGQQKGTVTCSGTQCSEAAAGLGTSFPCDYSVDYAVDWVAP